MEKKKESKHTPTNSEPNTAEYGTKEAQYQTGVVGLGKKNSQTDSPSHDNLTGLYQQYPPIVQWSYTPQTTLEHPSPVILKNSLHNQQTPAHQQQPMNTINDLQSQFAQSTGSFWLPRPEIPSAGATYHSPLGTTDSSWQSPMAIGASAGHDLPVSTFCYQGGYSYPMGFPGHWDPTWWGQTQTQFPFAVPYLPFSGGYGFFSVPPSIADGSALGRVHQRGIIRPPEKLSHKHHRLWEVQSAENVHLWTSLSHVEAELAACRSRLVKLESELFSLKPNIIVTVEGSSGAAAAIQSSKKGRPKRPATNVLASPDDSQSRPCGRKPGSNKVQAETKGLDPEKDNSNQLEDGAKTCNQMHAIGMPSVPEETDGKISTIFANTNRFELNGNNLRLASEIQTTATIRNQIQPESLQNQISRFGLKSTIETKGNGKEDDRKTAFSVLSRNVKTVDTGDSASAPYRGMGNGTHGWPSNVLPEDCGRNNILGVATHGFYDNGNVIRQGNKVIWKFVNENVSKEHAVDEGSGKDYETGEMEEDASSAVAKTNRTKGDGTFGLDPSAVMPKVLPQLNRW